MTCPDPLEYEYIGAEPWIGEFVPRASGRRYTSIGVTGPICDTGLFRVCRSINEEAAVVFWKATNIVFETDNADDLLHFFQERRQATASIRDVALTSISEPHQVEEAWNWMRKECKELDNLEIHRNEDLPIDFDLVLQLWTACHQNLAKTLGAYGTYFECGIDDDDQFRFHFLYKWKREWQEKALLDRTTGGTIL